MATKAQKVKVGIFLIAGFALILAIFLVVTVKNRQPTDRYYIIFKESVSGLAKDCTVLYQGVPVGKVMEIRVSKDNNVLVSVGVDRDLVVLRKGTVAMLALGNLMGGMQIELSGGEPGNPVLPPESYIPSKTSVLENIAQDLPQILEQIASILAKIDDSIGEVKGGRLGELVRNADGTLKTADRTLAELTVLLQTTRGSMINTEYEVTQTMRALREAVAKADKIFTQLNEKPSSILWGAPLPRNPRVR